MTSNHQDKAGDSGSVRPYVITGGRTRATESDLPIETVVQATGSVGSSELDFERRAIARLCAEPQSIADLAGRLDLPLGVARFLVSDMTSDGLLRTNGTADSSDPVFIARLIDGIRSL